MPSSSPTSPPTSLPTELLQGTFSYFTVQFEVAYLNNTDFYSSTVSTDTFQQSLSSLLDGVNSNDIEILSLSNHDYSLLPFSLRPPYISTDIKTNVYFFNSYVGSGRRLFYSQYDYYIHLLEQSIYPISDNFTDTIDYFATALACSPLQNVTVVGLTVITEATPLSRTVAPSEATTVAPNSAVGFGTGTAIIACSVVGAIVLIGGIFFGYRFFRRRNKKANSAFERWNQTYVDNEKSTISTDSIFHKNDDGEYQNDSNSDLFDNPKIMSGNANNRSVASKILAAQKNTGILQHKRSNSNIEVVEMVNPHVTDYFEDQHIENPIHQSGVIQDESNVGRISSSNRSDLL
jgi:hypothetical protein